MTIKKLNEECSIAEIISDTPLITDGQSALDLIMTARYETGCDSILINKEAFSEDFFILSTGLAGDVLQKFINYHIRAAIYGDYSKYHSKPLRDFIYECNHGHDIFFKDNRDEAAAALDCRG